MIAGMSDNFQDYAAFLKKKSQVSSLSGFKPLWMPGFLKGFQVSLDDWAIRKGRAAVLADCGMGKGFPGGTPVLMPHGWGTIGQLSNGDLVIGQNGEPTEVISVYARGLQPVYRVTFSDECSIICDGDHLWNVKSFNDVARHKPWRTMETRDLAHTQLKYGTHGQSRTWQIPLVKPVHFHPRQVPIHPYLLGVLLGDGHLKGTIEWTKPDRWIADKISGLLPDGCKLQFHESDDRCESWSIVTDLGRNPLNRILKDMGLFGKLSHDKFVPDAYTHNTVQVRIQILQGLMDTDGYAGDTPEFSSASQRLAATVVELVQSLGGTANLAIKEEPTYEYKGETRIGKPSYRVTMSLPPGINPFSTPRKAEAFKTPSRGVGRWIDSIEPIGQQETVCIKVAAQDGLFVTDHYIVTHNTPMLLVWAENVVRHTNKPVLILTPLAVSHQTVREAEKFGIEAYRSGDGVAMPNITVTNYERLEKFNPDDYAGVVCDEASCLKHYTGATQKAVTRFLSKIQFRLLCTATPAPNDYTEIGTLSEALGDLTYSEMLATFFRQISDDEKKQRATSSDIINSKRLSWRVLQSFGQWALRAHAFEPFWKWVSSWARACRKPSDLGDFDDSEFVLPPLNRRDHTVEPRTPPPGFLFTIPAFGLNQERAERRRTLDERSELVVNLTKDSDSAVIWCQLNPEGDRLEKDISGAVQVKGSQSMDQKEELILAFLDGQARVLVTKSKIAGLGLNLQHCAHVVTFVTHSYEGFYQSVRRCWRFGQKRPVTLDVIATEGEVNVRKNMERKEKQASLMFDSVIKHLNDSLAVRKDASTIVTECPAWLLKPN